MCFQQVGQWHRPIFADFWRFRLLWSIYSVPSSPEIICQLRLAFGLRILPKPVKLVIFKMLLSLFSFFCDNINKNTWLKLQYLFLFCNWALQMENPFIYFIEDLPKRHRSAFSPILSIVFRLTHNLAKILKIPWLWGISRDHLSFFFLALLISLGILCQSFSFSGKAKQSEVSH